jgi:hypothetical protein
MAAHGRITVFDHEKRQEIYLGQAIIRHYCNGSSIRFNSKIGINNKGWADIFCNIINNRALEGALQNKINIILRICGYIIEVRKNDQFIIKNVMLFDNLGLYQ